jgi:translocation and assembly module TamB
MTARSFRLWLVLLGVLVAAAVGVTLGLRYGGVTRVGRDFIEAQVGGLKVGRLGRLQIAGLKGDIWGDFTLARLDIADDRGIWLDARDIRVRWSPSDLLGQSVHFDHVAARTVTVLRRPILSPARPPKPRTVSIRIDDLHARLVTLPAFSIREGVYDVSGSGVLERGWEARARLLARSALHPGDYLRLSADAPRGRFVIDADALEARGGALAGALGLAADQAFTLTAHAAGVSGAGRIVVSTHVGAVQPLALSGAWTRAGGHASGHIQLAASSLLASWTRRLGPSVAFAISAHPAPDRFTQLGLSLVSQNANLSAVGEVDPARRRTGAKGLAVDLRIADASRLTSVARLGAGRMVGGLGGGPDHWVFAGRAVVDRPGAGGFTLARIAGPLRLEGRGGALTVDASAKGEGGAGHGLLAALLGASPSGSVQLTRLAGGRILIRRLTLAGPGLQLAASGDRGLLGDLSFKGSAVLTNLAAARQGARGAIKADWTAAQASGGKPWSVSFDAAGQNFAAGLGEVDRLLGPSPRLRMAADLGPGGLAVSRSTLDGVAGSVAASGMVSAARTVALKLDWRVSGPFRVGPLEIAGAANGTGALTGPLAGPRADLMANFDHVDIPAMPLRQTTVHASFQGGPGGAAGHIEATGASPWGAARGASTFRFAPTGVDLTDLDLNAAGVSATGAIALRRAEPSSADLTLAIGKGALLAEGSAKGRLTIVDAPGGARASLALEASDARLAQGGIAVKTLTIRADGPLAHLPYQVAGEGETQGSRWRLAGSGDYGETAGDRTVSFSGAGQVRRISWRTLEPARLDLSGDKSSADMRLAVGGGRADLVLAKTGARFSLKGSLSDVGLDLINRDYVGRFDANLALAGAGPALTGEAVMRLTGAGGRDLKGVPPVDGAIKAALSAGHLTLDAAFTDAKGLEASASLVLPAQASAAPFRIAVDHAAPLQGRFHLTGETKPIWTLLMGADRSLAGRVTAAGTLAGTLGDPKAVGTLALDAGRFEDAQTGLRLENVFLRASLGGDKVDIAHLEAADGLGGQVSGQGRVSLDRQGVSTFRLALDRFRLIDNDTGQASASGVATVSRAPDGRIKLTGVLTLDRAQVSPKPPVPSGVVAMDVVEIHRPGAGDEERSTPAKPPPPVELDITFKAARGVLVKGRGLDVDLSLDAEVKGTTAEPILTGAAHIVRGDYDFAGQRFTFDDLGSVTLGSRPELIKLDLTATRQDPTLTAVIKIRGTAARPEITLTSTPVLPTDEVLSQVLFGASASQLTGLQAAQLASALSGLASGGGFDVLGGLRGLAHLDRLALGSAATGGAVVAGKYLRNNVYLELGGGGHGGGSAQVEWRVRKRLSLVSRVGGQGDSGLSIRWRNDF